jgi:hypothetical protein
MEPQQKRELARQLRDDAVTVRKRLPHEGDGIADRLKQAADLLDGRAESGIEPLRYPDS